MVDRLVTHQMHSSSWVSRDQKYRLNSRHIEAEKRAFGFFFSLLAGRGVGGVYPALTPESPSIIIKLFARNGTPYVTNFNLISYLKALFLKGEKRNCTKGKGSKHAKISRVQKF